MDTSLKVGVILSMTATTLEITVCDQGTGPPGRAAIPNIHQKMRAEEHPRGMGMFLIQGLMDEVEWINSLQTVRCARW